MLLKVSLRSEVGDLLRPCSAFTHRVGPLLFYPAAQTFRKGRRDQSAESPQDVRKRPTVLNGSNRHKPRSGRVSLTHSTAATYAGRVRAVLRHLTSSGALTSGPPVSRGPQGVRTSRHHRTGGGSCAVVTVRPEVPVGVERRLRTGMPQAGLDDLPVGAAGDEQGRQVVAQIVAAEVRREPRQLGRAARMARSSVRGESC